MENENQTEDEIESTYSSMSAMTRAMNHSIILARSRSSQLVSTCIWFGKKVSENQNRKVNVDSKQFVTKFWR